MGLMKKAAYASIVFDQYFCQGAVVMQTQQVLNLAFPSLAP